MTEQFGFEGELESEVYQYIASKKHKYDGIVVTGAEAKLHMFCVLRYIGNNTKLCHTENRSPDEIMKLTKDAFVLVSDKTGYRWPENFYVAEL